jgi:hypothetical protein
VLEAGFACVCWKLKRIQSCLIVVRAPCLLCQERWPRSCARRAGRAADRALFCSNVTGRRGLSSPRARPGMLTVRASRGRGGRWRLLVRERLAWDLGLGTWDASYISVLGPCVVRRRCGERAGWSSLCLLSILRLRLRLRLGLRLNTPPGVVVEQRRRQCGQSTCWLLLHFVWRGGA